MPDDPMSRPGNPPGRWRRLWIELSSVRLFIWIACLVLVACVIGGVIPQDEAADRLFDRLGPLFGGAGRLLGFGRVFSQAWFVALLALLAVNLAACSIRSYRTLSLPTWVSHVGLLVVLAGGVLTGAAGVRGTMQLTEGVATPSFSVAGVPRDLGFAVRLRKFTIEYYNKAGHQLYIGKPDATPVALEPGRSLDLGSGRTLVMVDAFTDLVMGDSGAMNRSDSPNNPAVRVRVTQGVTRKTMFVFENFPLFYKQHGGDDSLPDLYYRYEAPQIKQFVSAIEILEGGKTVTEAMIFVNSPFAWKGWRLYQSGYDPDRGEVSILQVSRDPGTPVVYAGFVILTLGLMWSLFKGGKTDERGVLA